MHIVVCMKQVPRDNSVTIRPDLSINAEGIEQIMNLFDEYAVEEALRWNEQLGGKVTILSLGPEAWNEQIRRALAMGAIAIGSIAIGKIFVGWGRIKKLQIDELEVGRIVVRDPGEG